MLARIPLAGTVVFGDKWAWLSVRLDRSGGFVNTLAHRVARTAALGLALALPCVCSAGVSYAWLTDQAMYTAPVGSTVPIKIYLVETCTDWDTSKLVAEDGLFSFDYAVTRKSGTATFSDGSVAPGLTPYADPDPAFAIQWSPARPFRTSANVSLQWTADIYLPAGWTGKTTADPNVRRVPVGVINLTADKASTFTVGPLAGGGGTYTFAGTDLGAEIVPYTFTVAVPEPTSLGYLATAGLLLIRRRK